MTQKMYAICLVCSLWFSFALCCVWAWLKAPTASCKSVSLMPSSWRPHCSTHSWHLHWLDRRMCAFSLIKNHYPIFKRKRLKKITKSKRNSFPATVLIPKEQETEINHRRLLLRQVRSSRMEPGKDVDKKICDTTTTTIMWWSLMLPYYLSILWLLL